MYRLAVKRDFIAQHYLAGGDWGPENKLHSHHYRLELQLEGDSLDKHGFLVDIVAVEAVLDEIIAGYRDQILNNLPHFEGFNPSIEHFSRILCRQLADIIHPENICTITVKLWETDSAWASYSQPIYPS